MMHRRPRLLARLVVALMLGLLPLSGAMRAPIVRTSVASGGVVATPLSRRAVEREREKADVRRRLAERGSGTYINEMLAERDSALARWPDASATQRASTSRPDRPSPAPVTCIPDAGRDH